MSKLVVCMHQISSLGADFRSAMEGYSQAGIIAVEPHLEKAKDFEAKNGKGSARELLNGLGLSVVSSSNQLYLDETGPLRDQALEDLKWKLDLMASIGADRLVIPSAASGKHIADDYIEVYENLTEAAEMAKPYQVSLMVEFTRISTLIGNLRTALKIVRDINHPNLKNMIDIYHLWSGTSKFEDLDGINVGEIHHVHIADVPESPNVEVFEQKDRAWPGEGIAPMQKIIDKLVSKGYEGALSLELFDPVVQRTDPQIVAKKALHTISNFIN